MMEEKTICPACGQENDANFRFCKNCGAELPARETSSPDPAATAQAGQWQSPEIPPQPYMPPGYGQPNQNSGYSYNPPPYCAPNPDLWQNYTDENGNVVTGAEMHRFIGKNADKLLGKFAKSERSGSKAGWCWPVFILTYLFGFAGASFWFFYRKMNRLGVLLLCIGIVIAGVLDVFVPDPAFDFDQVFNEDISLSEILEFSDDAETPVSRAATAAGDVLDLAGAIVLAIFATSIYKKHCMKQILSIRQNAQDQAYVTAMYSQCGGTSGGMATASVFIFLFASTVLTQLIAFLL